MNSVSITSRRVHLGSSAPRLLRSCSQMAETSRLPSSLITIHGDTWRKRAVTRAATEAPSIMQLRIGFMPVAHPAMKTPSRVAS